MEPHLNKVFVMVRQIGSPGYQAVQAARALRSYCKKYPDDKSDNVILLEMPKPSGIYQFFAWIDLFNQHGIRHHVSWAWLKHDANIFKTAIALGAEGEPYVSHMPLFGHQIRNKPDIL